MAKTMKKKAPIAKAQAKRAPTKKAAAKSAKPMKAQKPKKMAKEHGEGSFMWKLLKKKEAERLARQEGDKGSSKFNMHKMETQLPTGVQGYSRFAGPRRRAA
jgi:hypothetical protein